MYFGLHIKTYKSAYHYRPAHPHVFQYPTVLRLARVYTRDMEFNPGNQFKKMHETQPALPTIVKELVKKFEQQISFTESVDYNGPSPERYVKLSVGKLIELHLA